METWNCPCRLYKVYNNNIGFFSERKQKGLEYSSSILGIMAVACQYCFATNKYVFLHFYFFNHLYIAYW